MTKKELKMLENYNDSINRYGYRNIWQAYDKCSFDKEKEYCKIESEFLNNYALLGKPTVKRNIDCWKYGLTVVNTNSFYFTVGYMIDYIDEETGEIIKQVLVYHTYKNRYIIEL